MYLPDNAIAEVFDDTEAAANTPKLQQLTEYVQDTWVDSIHVERLLPAHPDKQRRERLAPHAEPQIATQRVEQ